MDPVYASTCIPSRALGVIAVLRAQVGFHNRLPRHPGLGLLAGLNRAIGYFPGMPRSATPRAGRPSPIS
jgi:hypothetical protein